jgi:hypothetical protein
MKQHAAMIKFIFALALSASLLGAGPGAAQTVMLAGSDGQTATVDPVQLANLPRETVEFDIHGSIHRFEGPLLIDVVERVGAEKGRALRGAALGQAVIVEAADGYRVAYGLGELDAGTRPNRVILADRMDGQPLSAEDGPWRVIVEGDLRPARGVRQVTRIRVVDLGQGAPAPAH